jgi:hypothetical protein
MNVSNPSASSRADGGGSEFHKNEGSPDRPTRPLVLDSVARIRERDEQARRGSGWTGKLSNEERPWPQGLGINGFQLKSLILAQIERWRRG